MKARNALYFFETVYVNLKFKEAELWTNNNIKSYNAR